jgi:hypothetical protein
MLTGSSKERDTKESPRTLTLTLTLALTLTLTLTLTGILRLTLP